MVTPLERIRHSLGTAFGFFLLALVVLLLWPMFLLARFLHDEAI